MFEGLKEIEETDGRKKAASFAFALAIEAVIVLAIVVTPLIFFSVLPENELLTFLIAPPPPPPTPPPPPPPPPPPTPQNFQVQQVVNQGFVAPPEIPKDIPPPMDDIPYDPNMIYNPNGVRGPATGYAGGREGGTGVGVYRGVAIDSSKTTENAPPPKPEPEKPKPKPPAKISSGALASNAIRKVEPKYPPAASRAKITGRVIVEVVIDEDGNVIEAKAKSGHILLRPAAEEAIKQWKYKPATASGEPVSVTGEVIVNFGM